MLTNSDISHLSESADHYLEARKEHNERLSALLTQAARIPIDDPVVQREREQRRIVDLALVALGQGNSQKTRELLKQL